MVLPFEDGASYRRSSLIAAIHQGCAILTTEPAHEIETFAHGRNLLARPALLRRKHPTGACALDGKSRTIRRIARRSR